MRTRLGSVDRDGDQFRIKGHASTSEVVWTGVALVGLSVSVFFPAVPIIQRGLAVAFGLVLAAGLGGMLRRDVVTLDPRRRTWTRQTGYWSARTRTGGFNELKGLVLTREGTRRPRWLIYLAIRGDHHPIRVAAFGSESTAYARFEALARTLQVDAIDQTDHQEIRLALEAIDAVHSGRRQDPVPAISPLPAGSTLHVAGVPPDVSIVLPSLAFSVAGVLLGTVGLLLGSLFAGFGVVLWSNRVPDANGLPGATYPLILCCILSGIAIILFTLAMCIRREEFQNRGDRLVVGYRLCGQLIRRQVFDKRSIEEIAIRMVAGHMDRHVFLRSSIRILRVGLTLGPADQEWLQSTLTSWMRH